MKRHFLSIGFLFLAAGRILGGPVEDGDALQAKGDFDGAISNYTKAIVLNRDTAEAYNNRGNAERAKGELDAAMADYNQALLLQTNYAVAFLNRGNIKGQKGDFDGAIADYDQAIEFKPDFATAYFSRGNDNFIRGDLDGAIADYDKAIELQPSYTDALFNRRFAKIKKGDQDGQAVDRVKYLAILSNSPTAYFNSAKLESSFDLDDAILDYSNAVRLNSQYIPAYNALGNLRYQRSILDNVGANYTQGASDLADAITNYTKVIELLPFDAQAYYYRAVAKRGGGDVTGAIEDFKTAFKANHDENFGIMIRTNLASTCCANGYLKMRTEDFKGAIADFSDAIAVQPDDAYAYSKRGLVRSMSGEWDGATADFNKAIAVQPNYADAYCGRALARIHKSDLTGAITDLNEAITVQPDFAMAYYYRGKLKGQENDLAGALADFQKAVDLESDENRVDNSAQDAAEDAKVKISAQEALDQLKKVLRQ